GPCPAVTLLSAIFCNLVASFYVLGQLFHDLVREFLGFGGETLTSIFGSMSCKSYCSERWQKVSTFYFDIECIHRSPAVRGPRKSNDMNAQMACSNIHADKPGRGVARIRPCNAAADESPRRMLLIGLCVRNPAEADRYRRLGFEVFWNGLATM